MKKALSLFAAAICLAALWPTSTVRAAEPVVLVATLNGVINPITDNYISRAVDRAVAAHASALIIQMDTPGGLDTSMRSIIKKMLGAPLPVAVFVSPSGARAASAGLYITEAADVAAMAPGTNIGSAHPVSLSGGNPGAAPSASPGANASSVPDIESIKIENDAAAYIRALAALHHRNADWAEQAVRQSVNVPADQAVKLGVVELETRDLDTLLQDLNGRQVVKNGQTYTLQTARAAIERYDLGGIERLLQSIADPNLVYLLFLLAIIGIGFWVTHPGLVLPGVVGVIAGILAALTLFDLPINIAGVVLILLAVLLFVIDLKAVTHGVLTTGGIVAMTLGGLLLIDTGFLAEGINIALLLGTVLAIGAIFLFILRKLVAARRQPYEVAESGLVGKQGVVREALDPTGMVFVDGVLWQASSTSSPLPPDTPVRVVAADGFRLRVEPLSARRPTTVPEPPQAVSG